MKLVRALFQRNWNIRGIDAEKWVRVPYGQGLKCRGIVVGANKRLNQVEQLVIDAAYDKARIDLLGKTAHE